MSNSLKQSVKAVHDSLTPREKEILEKRFSGNGISKEVTEKAVDRLIGKAQAMSKRRKEEKKMNIKALSDKVWVRRCEAEEVTPGGIIIPEAAKEKPTEGIVVSAGPGRIPPNGTYFVPTTVKEGDKVLLPSWGAEVEVDGQKFVVVPEESILGVFDKEG